MSDKKLSFFSVLLRFFFRDDLAQSGAGETVIPAVEIQLNALLLTIFASRKVFVPIFIAHNADIDFKGTQDILQILLGDVRHNLVYIYTATKLYIALDNGLRRLIFFRTVQGWVQLQTTDQVIALALGLGEHHDMA